MTGQEVISGNRVIAFHRSYVEIGKSITSALMLSQAIYWTGKSKNDGWFFKTQEEWKEETGMTRSEQETARKALIASGVWDEKYERLAHRQWYRVNIEKMAELLSECGNPTLGNAATTKQETSGPECRNPAVGKEAIPHSSSSNNRLQEEKTKESTATLFPESELQKTSIHPDIGKSKEEHNLLLDFQIETIRKAYPKLIDAGPARKAIKKALEKRTFEFLLAKTESFGICKMTTDPKYIKSPQNWFNDENYDDDPAQWTDTPHQDYLRKQATKQTQGPVSGTAIKMLSAEERRRIRQEQETEI